MSIELNSHDDVEAQKERVLDLLKTRSEIVTKPATEFYIEKHDGRVKLEVYFWINVRETNAEKLKSLLASKIESSPAANSVKVNTSKEASTHANANEILQEANKSMPQSPNEVDLISDHR